MYIAIAIIILILCVLLSVIILVQNPKGGGLNQSLGGVSTQVFGAKNSTDLVEKVTWYMGLGIVVLSILSTIFINKGNVEDGIIKSDAETFVEEGAVPTTTLPTNTLDMGTLPAENGGGVAPADNAPANEGQ